MSRAARLLSLMQALRRHRRAVTARELADELGVAIRTVYRDVATLQAEGAAIEGKAGYGYVLREGFFLPPLMFDADEIDALILGLRLVEARGDPDLGTAASDALAKIVAILPPPLADVPATSGLLVGPVGADRATHLGLLRHAIRAEARLDLGYTDKAGRSSRRVVWPIAIGFFEDAEVLAAWCEMRSDFRHFRLDRIASLVVQTERMPRRHRLLLAEWRVATGLAETC